MILAARIHVINAPLHVPLVEWKGHHVDLWGGPVAADEVILHKTVGHQRGRIRIWDPLDRKKAHRGQQLRHVFPIDSWIFDLVKGNGLIRLAGIEPLREEMGVQGIDDFDFVALKIKIWFRIRKSFLG